MTSAARIYAKPFPMHYTIAMTKVGLIILQLILLFISMDVKLENQSATHSFIKRENGF